jgi:sarcosine oxidase/L-pipecolate oxidase
VLYYTEKSDFVFATCIRIITFQRTSKMESSRKTTKVIVVGGGGTMGSSTALHLIRNGYTPSNITVLDTYEIPSAQSAGNDLNKIMGIRLRNPVDVQLSLEARDMWRNDPLFKSFFHNTGRVSQVAYGKIGNR